MVTISATLWINAYYSTLSIPQDWMKVGDSPYLQNTNDDYIHTYVPNDVDGVYYLENMPGTIGGSIISCYLFIEAKTQTDLVGYRMYYNTSPVALATADIYVTGGFFEDTYYHTNSFNVMSMFKTTYKIDDACFKVKKLGGDNSDVNVRRMYMIVKKMA